MSGSLTVLVCVVSEVTLKGLHVMSSFMVDVKSSCVCGVGRVRIIVVSCVSGSVTVVVSKYDCRGPGDYGCVGGRWLGGSLGLLVYCWFVHNLHRSLQVFGVSKVDCECYRLAWLHLPRVEYTGYPITPTPTTTLIIDD